MKRLNSYMFEDVYKGLQIDLDELGCIMLNVEPVRGINIDKDWLYYTKDTKKFWIDGYVFDKVAHLTLLYGLLDSGHNWEKHVETVLKEWKMDTVEVESIGYFDSPYKEEEYYCIVAHIKVTDELMEGHQRLEFLPHINTFNGYKPHVTLAYVKKDEQIRDSVIAMFNNMIGYKLPVKSLNLGDKPSK